MRIHTFGGVPAFATCTLLGLAIYLFLIATGPFLGNGGFLLLPHLLTAGVLLAAAGLAIRGPVPLPAPGWIGSGLFFIGSMSIVGLTLQALHGGAINTGWVDFGIFPIHDAYDFLTTAFTFLHEGRFETPRGRPITNVIVAGLLAMAGLNLLAVAAVTTALAGIGVWLTGTALWRGLGLMPAVLMATMMFDFFHEQIASTSSEPIGFIVGCAAFVLLWESVRRKRRGLFLLGILAFTLAMLVRIGPMFVLPTLLVWAGFLFRGGRRFDWRMPVAGLAIVVAAFAVNGQVTKSITPTSGGSFVNAADSWYAVFVEGELALGMRSEAETMSQTRWIQIYRDHPELQTLPRQEMVDRKKAIVLDRLLTQPHVGFVGALLSWNQFIFDSRFLEFVEPMWLRAPLVLLSIAGIATMVIRRRDPLHGLALVGFLGIFLSIPFLYGGGARVLAGAVGFLSLLPVFGLAALIRWAGRLREARDISSDLAPVPLTAIATALLVCPFLLAAYALAAYGGTYRVAASALPECPGTDQPVMAPLPAGLGLTILSADQPSPNRLPAFQKDRLQEIAAGHSGYWRSRSATNLASRIGNTEPPASFVETFDLVSGTPLYLIMKPVSSGQGTRARPLCVETAPAGTWRRAYTPEGR